MMNPQTIPVGELIYETDDGHNISFSSGGLSIQTDGTNETQLRAAVSLFTASPSYQWLIG